MEFNRDQLPENLTVSCSLSVTREELIEILNFWMKNKMNSRVVLEDIEIQGSAEILEKENSTEYQEFKLEKLIVSGKENIPLNWKKP